MKAGDAPELDVLDGLRYGIASYEYPEEKPAAERRREAVASVPVVGSGRLTTGKAFDLEERKTSGRVYIGTLQNGRKAR